MPAAGTPEEQESNPSAPSSTNSGGASAKTDPGDLWPSLL